MIRGICVSRCCFASIDVNIEKQDYKSVLCFLIWIALFDRRNEKELTC